MVRPSPTGNEILLKELCGGGDKSAAHTCIAVIRHCYLSACAIQCDTSVRSSEREVPETAVSKLYKPFIFFLGCSLESLCLYVHSTCTHSTDLRLMPSNGS